MNTVRRDYLKRKTPARHLNIYNSYLKTIIAEYSDSAERTILTALQEQGIV